LSLLLTFGLAMVIEQSLRMIFGATPLPGWCAQGCRTRTWSALSASRCSPT
jgi:hypothetical protein